VKRTLGVVLTLLCLGVRSADATSPPAGPSGFELKDGDRVVFVGDTLIERDATHGYLETILTSRSAERQITFRNLGWSGDTVYGHARGGFGTPADGFKSLESHILAMKPTVIFAGYGMTDSFDGEAGLSRFAEGLNRLLDVFARTGARVVLISPIPHERSDLGPGSSEIAARHNQVLPLYRAAIQKAAEARGHLYIDLSGLSGPAPITDNGIHLNALGYREFARVVAAALGSRETGDGLRIEDRRDGAVPASPPIEEGKVGVAPGAFPFEATARVLPSPRMPGRVAATTEPQPAGRTLRFAGLVPGRYTLKIDGKAVATAEASAWDKGERIHAGPDYDQVEALRQAIIAKNRLYFYRWRPQNETYLFGFRKHEQGNYAREIPEFDPLVAEQEESIARLRVPVKHVYELVKEGEAGP